MHARHIQFEADFSSFSQSVTLHIQLLLFLCVEVSYRACFLFAPLASSAIHSDVCIIIRSCFTVSCTPGRRENVRVCRASKRDIKTSTPFTIEKNPRMQFHFVSHHILRLFTWLFISVFLSFVCSLFLGAFFFGETSYFLGILLPGKVDVSLRVSVFAFVWKCYLLSSKSNCHIHLISWKSVYRRRAVYAHYASCNIKSKCTCHLKWKKLSFLCFTCCCVCVLAVFCAVASLWEKIIMISVCKHVSVDSSG